MTGVLTLTRTSIGKKAIMAVTGLILAGFLVFHMYGNTKMYQGAEVFNAYAAGLRELGHPILGHEHLLWVARVVLLVSVVAHIWAASSLTMQSQKTVSAQAVSGRQRYGKKQRQTGYAAYTMRYGGILIFLFVIYHILHLTFGAVGYSAGQYKHPEGDEYFVYNNVVLGFQNPLIVGFYAVTMVFVGFHLFHGVWSAFQTLGLNNRTYNSLFRGLAILVAVVVVLGNLSFPIAVYAGLVPLAPAV